MWNNRNILYKNKSIFFQNWFDKNILLVSQLLISQGLLFSSYKEFLDHFQFPVSPKEFAVVMGLIPSGVLILLRGAQSQLSVSLSLVNNPVGKLCLASPYKNNNRSVRSLFQQNIVTLPPVTAYWSNAVDLLEKSVDASPFLFCNQ